MDPLLVVMSVIWREDWLCFASAWVYGVLARDPEKGRTFVKLCDAEGAIDVYLARWCVQQDEGADASVLSLENMPSSRHITRQPETKHIILQRFKRPQVASGAGDSAAWGPRNHMSGICSIPLQAPPEPEGNFNLNLASRVFGVKGEGALVGVEAPECKHKRSRVVESAIEKPQAEAAELAPAEVLPLSLWGVGKSNVEEVGAC